MKYVIIGNSICAVGAIEGIRQIDKTGEITVVGGENRPAYARPLISYLIEGKTDLSRISYRADSFYKDNNVTLLLGVSAVKIDSENKVVSLDDGKTLQYDKLLLASGSRPFIPPIEGYNEVENKTTFMTIDDALYLEKHCDKDKKVLIMGAGLIGLKCAECLSGKVKTLTVVDLADHILPSILNKEESAPVLSVLEEHGVSFHLSSSVVKFTKTTATLSSGETLDFDILVSAVGVRPNVELLREIGAETDRGILINDKCETSLIDVYAGGDCAEKYDISFGKPRMLAILPNAYIGGETAGINMAGGEKLFDNAIPMNSIGFFGFHIISAGTYSGEERSIISEKGVRKFYISDNLLKGFILIGDVSRGGIYTSLIRNRVPLDTIDFELIVVEPSLICFSKDARRQIFTKNGEKYDEN